MILIAPHDVQFDPERRRWYLVNPDSLRNPSDYEVLNLEDLFPGRSDGAAWYTGGARRYKLAERDHESMYGLPDYKAKPKVFVALKNQPLDIYGFLWRRVISSRAKRLLCDIDPAAFDFVECETITRKNLSVESYWVMASARVVHDFDEKRSVFELAKGEDGMTGEPYEGPHFANVHDLHMLPDFPADHHSFFLSRYAGHFIFSEAIADAWREHKFTGAEFIPLQHPTPAEAKVRPPHVPYWWSKYKAHQDSKK
jgi:hypothetical protein